MSAARFIAKRIRREVEDERARRQGTMQAGMPKVRILESDLVSAISALERLAEIEDAIEVLVDAAKLRSTLGVDEAG